MVIESEFAITKLPTKSAMPPNVSRKPRRNEMNESVSLASSAACSAPVRTSAFAGRIVLIWATRSLSETFGLAPTSISSNWSGLSKRLCAVGTSKPASVAPPRLAEPEPNLTRPEILNLTTGPSAWTPITSPTAKCSFFAVVWSITTSSPWGQRPETSESGLKREAPLAMLKPRFGAPP
jgi:hypothetical protein